MTKIMIDALKKAGQTAVSQQYPASVCQRMNTIMQEQSLSLFPAEGLRNACTQISQLLLSVDPEVSSILNEAVRITDREYGQDVRHLGDKQAQERQPRQQ